MKKLWRDLPAFSPPPQSAASDRLTITGFRAWRLREPASGRRYTVVKLESRGGLTGYGESGPVTASEAADAKSAGNGPRAHDGEFIRHRLAGSPAMEAAVNNALLDVAARSSNVPVYQYLGGPTRFKARVLAHLEGDTEDVLAESLRRAAKQGYKAFTFPIPARDS